VRWCGRWASPCTKPWELDFPGLAAEVAAIFVAEGQRAHRDGEAARLRAAMAAEAAREDYVKAAALQQQLATVG
jgi:hypothetical protein